MLKSELQSRVNQIKKGATVAPVIISTDKTHLTQFSGSKAAYPVYLTIGNIPKSLRRKPSMHAAVLVAYLSVDKMNRQKLTEVDHRSRIQRVFHESMRMVLESLKLAGSEGVEMISSDGSVRDVFPLLSCYVADYPEQCLVACAKGCTCPKCQAKSNELEATQAAEPRTQQWTQEIMEEGKTQSEGKPSKFHSYCQSHDVAGYVYQPFWEGFPLCDIHQAITPDVLHQLYQGVFKHIVSWCQRILSPQQLDQRIRCLPRAYGVRHFKNGLSALSQISGAERKNMAKILLGCLVGSLPKIALQAITAILDFIYIAQYPAHDSVTLGYLDDALHRFHQYRHYFVDIGIRKDFNIPKFHSLLHYADSIRAFGTTDNYNTEMFERLHIDFAKNGWRASNHRDEFPQMIRWLSRQEKITKIESHRQQAAASQTQESSISVSKRPPRISIPKFPNHPNRSITFISDKHRAPDFEYYLKLFLTKFQVNPISSRLVDSHSLSFTKVDTFDMFRFHPETLQDEGEEDDIVKAIPASSQLPEGRFDTVVALVSDTAESTGLTGIYCCSF